ncbi:aminotransferase class I/II-fold pyridoxal phosphate-dependent enzyme [Streptomyces sp. NPDC006872]|uniref:pyridoxal phosphate-dependent aminotransferase n=1 Tax=Streptomyces sp. NPDC006872 TaxID=3155720 RepID=UPI003402BE2C
MTTHALSFQPSEAVQRVERTSLRTAQPQSRGGLISLAMGEPDFATPPRVRAAAAQALEAGHTHYTDPQGDPELRAALAERVGGLKGSGVTPGQVLVTHGGSAALAAAILAVVNPGDRVVFPDPTYSLYSDLVNLAGGHCVPVPPAPDLHWDLDGLAEALRGAALFVFCNPSNPTGAVHTAEELAGLADITAATGTLVLADEAYGELVYTDAPFVSALQVPGLAERTLYCQTFSKSYAMTGWRLGYLTGPQEAISAAARIHATVNGSVNSAVQRAALTALSTADADIRRMRQAYGARRTLMLDELSRIPGLHTHTPQGAFYAFPSYDAAVPSADLVRHLRKHGVAVRPGSEFGAAGEGHLRLSYAAAPKDIVEGVRRLGRGLAALM